MARKINRRSFMGKSLFGAAAAGMSLENQALLAQMAQGQEAKAAQTPVSGVPRGKLGKLEVSRLICGGNLFSGFAHSRDLIYVSALMTTYFTPEKIMDTLQNAEQNGINTAILRCDEHIVGVLNRYRQERGGKIQWIAQTYPKVNDLESNIKLAIDNGAVAAYAQGGIGDAFAKAGKLELLGKIIAFIKQNGLVAGMGCHDLEVCKLAEAANLGHDFYFKTMNMVDYFSEKPEEIAAFMKTVEKPWIAFKILGAGLTEPKEGFPMAFKMGADFVNVGMFDWQVRDDAALIKEVLAGDLQRERPWRS